MPLQPRKAIAGLKPCAHGGINYAELKASGINAADVIDFSVSTNPFMPPPGIKEMMTSAPVERYPDSYSTLLRLKLSERLEVSAENIVAGSGTTELIRLIALAYFRRNDPVLIIGPAYGEYESACRLAGSRLFYYRAREKDAFVPDIAAVVKTIRQQHPRAVFICNPNNPTGIYLPRGDIEKITEAAEDCLLVIDEAYVPFVENRWNSLDLAERGNVIILRSMTKDYGIPGLRLGYAVACREISGVLRSVLPPWNVNAVAQQVGISVLENDEYLEESLRKTCEARRFLLKGLTDIGMEVVPSDTHYFLVKAGSGAEYRRALLKKNIMVRDCSSFGLPEYIRVSTRSLPDCRRLVTAFSEILKAGDKTV